MRTALRRLLAFTATAAFTAAAAFTATAPVATASAPVVEGAVVSVSPGEAETVGVAAPVTIRFAAPVADRAAEERSVVFSATAVPHGAFNWVDDKTMRWTPSEYWPAHSTITVVAAGFPHKFRTGSEVLGIASISQHTFTVKIDGKVVKTMPASLGKPKRPTPVGSFTTLEKQNPVIMDSRTIGIPLNSPEGYRVTVYDAVRITWGGVYVHAAPWSVASQGKANVSHGCINLSTENAAWYYNTVGIGDPVIVNA